MVTQSASQIQTAAATTTNNRHQPTTDNQPHPTTPTTSAITAPRAPPPPPSNHDDDDNNNKNNKNLGKRYLKSPNWIAHTLLELPFNCGDYQHLASGSEWLFRTAAGMTILNPGCLMTYSQWGAVIIHISQGWILFDAAVRLNGVGFGFQGLEDHHASVALRWTSFFVSFRENNKFLQQLVILSKVFLLVTKDDSW